MDAILEQMAHLIETKIWLAPIIAVISGLFTSFTPCCLSNIPIIIGYVGGIGEKNPKRALLLSLTFALGSTITFMALGLAASAAGKLFNHESDLYHVIIGIIMVLMALQTWEIVNFFPSSNLMSKNRKKGLVGAFLTGMLGGIFSTPCSTPVLVALLAIIAGQNNLLWGLFLMLMYSVGHNILIVLAGTSIGFVRKIEENEKYHHISHILKAVLGAVMLIIGVIMFSHIFTDAHVH